MPPLTRPRFLRCRNFVLVSPVVFLSRWRLFLSLTKLYHRINMKIFLETFRMDRFYQLT